MTATYLSWPAIVAGRERPVAALLDDPDRNAGRDGEILRLMGDGFTSYRQLDGALIDAVRDAIAAAVAGAGVKAAAVDAVLFASDSYWENEIERAGRYRHGISRFRLLDAAREAGLVNAQPFGNWMSACGNVGAALTLARGLIAAGQHRAVMVVSFDCMPAGAPRLMGNGTSLFSDGAAAFLVAADPQPLRLMGLASRSSARLADPRVMYNAANPALAMMETVKAVSQVKAGLAAQTARPPKEYAWLLMPNIRSDVAAALGGLLGVPAARLRRDTLGSHAHMHANDNLLTLLAMEAAGELPANDDVLLFNAGTWAWHLAAVRKVG